MSMSNPLHRPKMSGWVKNHNLDSNKATTKFTHEMKCVCCILFITADLVSKGLRRLSLGLWPLDLF